MLLMKSQHSSKAGNVTALSLLLKLHNFPSLKRLFISQHRSPTLPQHSRLHKSLQQLAPGIADAAATWAAIVSGYHQD